MRSNPVKFYVGLDRPSHAQHFDRSFISANQLRKRKSDFKVKDWIMDSGAFTEISRHGRYRVSVDEYASQVDRWSRVGNFRRAVIQDYMCEPLIVQRTGLTVAIHQQLTVERYDELRDRTGKPLMPVIQGFQPWEYLAHIEQYGRRLTPGMWVGVGSVCRRNTRPAIIEDILIVIKRKRPDLRLHGFGLKTTSLRSPVVRQLLFSADSMAWSFAARMEGRGEHDWREAKNFEDRINFAAPDDAVAKQLPIWV